MKIWVAIFFTVLAGSAIIGCSNHDTELEAANARMKAAEADTSRAKLEAANARTKAAEADTARAKLEEAAKVAEAETARAKLEAENMSLRQQADKEKEAEEKELTDKIIGIWSDGWAEYKINADLSWSATIKMGTHRIEDGGTCGAGYAKQEILALYSKSEGDPKQKLEFWTYHPESDTLVVPGFPSDRHLKRVKP